MLWVFAQPEQSSLNASLRDAGVCALARAGHICRMSDLYAMKWKPTVDRDDFTGEPAEPIAITTASEHTYHTNTLSADIRSEQDKLDWADAVVLQFPLWWYGPPAILKGWIDRVFVKGYAYGVRDPKRPGRTLRYGQGKLTGKRALVITSCGSPSAALGPRGINGQLDQVLFGLLHGTLWYVGMSVLPPLAICGADRVSAEAYEAAAALVCGRVTSIESADPLPFRFQNGGDYDDNLVLRPHLAPGASGLAVHYARNASRRSTDG